jgi:hypothetical protein
LGLSLFVRKTKYGALFKKYPVETACSYLDANRNPFGLVLFVRKTKYEALFEKYPVKTVCSYLDAN